MKSATRYVIVLVTAPDLDVARKLAKAALAAHAVACANLVPQLESHYWWQGKLESSQEVLVIMKTTKAKLNGLEKIVLAHHPYETPEIIALPLSQGNQKYLRWITDSVAAA